MPAPLPSDLAGCPPTETPCAHRAQKLEAMGMLTAGIAHEINTPVQYVSDNVAYLATGFGELRRTIETVLRAARHRDLAALDALQAGGLGAADEFLTEAPRALAECADGLTRVANMVAAVKSFAHPSHGVAGPFDLNQALTSALTLTRHEWRYVADAVTELDPALPPVMGVRDELCQAFLNLIVNASQAIESATDRGRLGRGRITVASRWVFDQVVVSIADTGAGIPEAIRGRVFEPFFTTKAVGRGTGLGLALVRDVVTRHRGTIRFDVSPHGGTTFHVTLPIGRGDPAP